MAIRAGQILHSGNSFVIDRIQTGGPGNLNIPQEKIRELGNYQTVGIVRDVPDLSFNLDCLDVSTEIEAILTGSSNPSGDPDGTEYQLLNAVPLDILSPWKSPYGAFTIVKGCAVPQLTLESASYRYGLRENAAEQFTLRGDAIFYVPGVPMRDEFTGDGSTTVFAYVGGPASLYEEGGDEIYALNVAVDGVRQVLGTDYTADDTAVTFMVAPANGKTIAVVYGSTDATSYLQAVHEGVSVKPAAIRGKDIEVYFSTAIAFGGGISNKALSSNVATLTTSSAHGLSVGDVVTISGVDSTFNGTFTVASTPTGTTFTYAKTAGNVSSTAVSPVGKGTKPVEVLWPDVQSVNIDWRVTLEDDYQFGDPRAVAREATDVPEVTGNLGLRPRSLEYLFTRLAQITGVDPANVIGPQSSVAGALRIVLKNPDSGGTTAVPAGTVLKTHYMPAARFVIPGYEGRVQQKVDMTLNFETDDGVLETYRGDRP